MKNNRIITIDGPSGSGKGTLSLLLAKALGWKLLDSGAIYRLCALDCLNKAIDLDDEEAVSHAAKALNISFDVTGNKTKALLDSKDVSKDIRQEAVGMAASKVAAYPGVRAALLMCQRQFASDAGLVADGRDMGTVVFPEAGIKFYLTASSQARAERRVKQLQDAGHEANYQSILDAIEQRDYQDKNRAVAPLRPAEGAIIVDSSALSIDEVLAVMLSETER